MKRIKTQRDMRPFIQAIIEQGKSADIMDGQEVEIEKDGIIYRAIWDTGKGLYVDVK